MIIKPVTRKAKREDIPSIVNFNQAMALETESISLDETILENGVETLFTDPSKGFYIVCEVDGQPVACLMITYEWSDWRNGTFWWIQSVYVKTQYRKKGLYKQMYWFIKTLVDSNNDISGIRLYVDNENTNAQNVYKNLGMKLSNYQMFEYSKAKE